MQKLLLPLLLLLALLPAAHAQIGINSPVGLAPRQDAEIYSRDAFVVQQKYARSTDPISGTFIMNCKLNSPPNLTETAGILTLLNTSSKGSYVANLNCTQSIITPGSPSSVGYELTFTLLDTEANGDSVVIEDFYGGRIAFSGSALPPVLLVPGPSLIITFKSDSDGNVGAGFALRWRRVSVVPSPTGGGDGQFGKALQYDLSKGALVGGLNGVGALQQAGDYATALGYRNRVNGENATALGSFNIVGGYTSVALGSGNIATGTTSIALGTSNKVSNLYSTALGSGNTVRGFRSTALGDENTVSGDRAIALGHRNTASGHYSTAIGSEGSTAGYEGAMVLSDKNLTSVSATANNQLTARFAGGYRFFTNSFLTTGVSLAAGGTSWATISDSTKKERFLPINGPALLQKISGMKLTTWNYKGQRDRRHYGPMAQEFFALFGQDALGEIGCDTLITTQDMEGLTLSAVQALVKENEQLRAELRDSRAETRSIASLQSEMQNRLHLLERAMLSRRERVSMRKQTKQSGYGEFSKLPDKR
jgi:hypothetical protein